MTKKDDDEDSRRIIATNHQASRRYEIIDTIEAGVSLTGPEVKSLRAGGANISDGFVRIEDETRVILWNVHISPYRQGSLHVVQEPTRARRLLLHRREIHKWLGRVVAKGLTVIPLEMYFNNRGRAKVKIALAKGKRGPDRREDLKKRTVNREIQREFSSRYRIK